jgi:hypothetical protein
MLKKSSPDMPNRFDPTFSGKNAAWSGSNISDGMWYGWTSGGRSATVISKQLPNMQTNNKTAVGWKVQNVVAADRSRETKLTPLGRYGWDTTVGSVLKAKVSGDLFLPLPNGYEKVGLSRGSQLPRVLQESSGGGVALPAADVQITNPVFGDTGTIEIEQPEPFSCKELLENVVWTPSGNDPFRSNPPPKEYPYRRAWTDGPVTRWDDRLWPEQGKNQLVIDREDMKLYRFDFDPCGVYLHPQQRKPPPPLKVPAPGNQDKRRQDKKKEQEDEKKKKQKMR